MINWFLKHKKTKHENNQLNSDPEFQQLLIDETMKSGSFRSLIVFLSGLIMLSILLISKITGYSDPELDASLNGFEMRFWLILILVGALSYELLAWHLLRKKKLVLDKKYFVYSLAFIEISTITMGIFLSGQVTDPNYALNTPPLLIYNVMIMFLALFLDPLLCRLAGLLAAVEYFCLAIVLFWSAQTEQVEFVIPHFIMVKSIILFISGMLSAFIAQEIKAQLIHSFNEKYLAQQRLLKQKQIALEQQQQLTNAYERFVPKQFLHFLEKESIVNVVLGDNVEKEMSILFSDVRDFTRLSEAMTPAENFHFINSYLRQMEPVIGQYSGFIDKYIGDAIMALFTSNADEAVKAAIAMLHTLRNFNQTRIDQGEDKIEIGIGLNTGLLMLGTVGGDNRMDGTVISDAVNLASRTEGMTKMYGATLLITEYTYQRLVDPSVYLIRIIDRVQVKGKSNSVTIYEVFDGDPIVVKEKKAAIVSFFEKGVFCYFDQQFEEAIKVFQQCLGIYPDKAVQLYLERCHYLLENGVADDWNGVTRMEIK